MLLDWSSFSKKKKKKKKEPICLLVLIMVLECINVNCDCVNYWLFKCLNILQRKCNWKFGETKLFCNQFLKILICGPFLQTKKREEELIVL